MAGGDAVKAGSRPREREVAAALVGNAAEVSREYGDYGDAATGGFVNSILSRRSTRRWRRMSSSSAGVL